MKFGKVRIENGSFIYLRHMMPNSIPCTDILWAYIQRGDDLEGRARFGRQLLQHYLVIHTRRGKRYRFEMKEEEAENCIRLLRVLHPEMAYGFPEGGRVELLQTSNTRDLGGLRTTDDRHILPHRLLRSDALYHLAGADQKKLAEEYRLRRVVDFRASVEVARKPDTMIPGVEYYHIPLLDEEMAGVSPMSSMEQAMKSFSGDTSERMETFYEAMMSDQYTVKQLARFVDLLLQPVDGAILWHCSAGKDRTGIATALVLTILGVPRRTIREDYVRSNAFLEPDLQYMTRLMDSRPGSDEAEKEALTAAFRVEESYLNKVFYSIDRNYGSMQNFLRKGLYLSPKAIDRLREKYLL